MNFEFRNTVSDAVAQLAVTLLVCSAGTLSTARADETTALSAIFDGTDAIESALNVHARAARMNRDEQFNFLKRRVLPPGNREVRLRVGFTPTNAFHGEDSHEYREGGELISPAIDLIAAAKELGQLEELQQSVMSVQPKTSLHTKNRDAFLVMIALALNHHDNALARLETFLRNRDSKAPTNSIEHAAEALLLHATKDIPDAREILQSPVDSTVQTIKALNNWTIWHRQFKTIALRSAAVGQELAIASINDTNEAEQRGDNITPSNWSAVGSGDAETRGTGIPNAMWRFGSGRVDNVTSHHDDYLFYNIPLRGNFQFECDFTSFNWTDTELLACGTWVSPVYNLEAYDVGIIRGAYERKQLSPRLSKIGNTLHYRTEVKDLVATTFVNGREIHRQTLKKDHDPWIAIRNDYKNEGSAFNVRVTGSPQVPDSIRLTSGDRLDGWRSYFSDSVSWSDSHWENLYRVPGRAEEPEEEVKNGGGLYARRDNYPDQEEALFYHRPMLEDGTIEYEFFYKAGEQTVHPAIDRLCFVLQPDGVQLHRLTDGPFDRTDLPPDNLMVEPGCQRGPELLPLANEEWNQVSVSLHGDTIRLRLNGTEIYERPLPDQIPRHFGFFHFADRSEVKVRNVIWRGQWDKTLPSIFQQRLAIDETRMLDDADHLTQVFEHDFAKDGLPQDGFAVIRGALEENIKTTSDGLLAIRPGANGYRNATIAPTVRLEGDFDVTVRYSDFFTNPTKGGNSSLMLIAMLEPNSDEFFVSRRHIYYPTGVQRQMLQCAVVERRSEGERRDYFVTETIEEKSGRLRLARRGNQIYFLSAEGDSPNFRLRGKREFSTAPVMPNGIRILAQTHQAGETRVVWKDVVVRAEKISGPAIGGEDARLTEINKRREALRDDVTYDFSNTLPDRNLLYVWGDSQFDNAQKGLKFVCVGANSWESSGLYTRHAITGNFDISVDFEDANLAKPAIDQQTTVYLQLTFVDNDDTQVSAMLNMADGGYLELLGQRRDKQRTGGYNYRHMGSSSVKKVSGLRVARHGKTITVIATIEEQGEQIVSVADVSDLPVANATFMLHTGGPNRSSDVVLKRFRVSAEQYRPPKPQVIPPSSPLPRPTKPKSLLESLFNSF